MDFDILNSKFTADEARMLNPLVLAFVGDAIYEVMVRTYLIDNNRDMLVHKLHKEAVAFVKAHAQSDYVKILQDEFTEEEANIFRRGRNAKSGTVPKNAEVQEYRAATGFESVLGFLYLTEQKERLCVLFNKIIEINSRMES